MAQKQVKSVATGLSIVDQRNFPSTQNDWGSLDKIPRSYFIHPIRLHFLYGYGIVYNHFKQEYYIYIQCNAIHVYIQHLYVHVLSSVFMGVIAWFALFGGQQIYNIVCKNDQVLSHRTTPTSMTGVVDVELIIWISALILHCAHG